MAKRKYVSNLFFFTFVKTQENFITLESPTK